MIHKDRNQIVHKQWASKPSSGFPENPSFLHHETYIKSSTSKQGGHRSAKRKSTIVNDLPAPEISRISFSSDQKPKAGATLSLSFA